MLWNYQNKFLGKNNLQITDKKIFYIIRAWGDETCHWLYHIWDKIITISCFLILVIIQGFTKCSVHRYNDLGMGFYVSQHSMYIIILENSLLCIFSLSPVYV